MSSAGSITRYLKQCRDGDAQAVQPIWDRYFARLTRLAERKLKDGPFASFDGEDAALEAFDSCFRKIREGRYAQLANRNELWELLARVVKHKVLDLIKAERRQKRNIGRRQEYDPGEVPGRATRLETIADSEPTPELQATALDEFQRLLEGLGEDSLRSIALLRMEGYTVSEIAAKLKCAFRTVERKLQLIRAIWSKEA